MSEVYLIREYGIINMCDAIIVDCYVTTQIPCNAVAEAIADVDGMLSVHGTCSTYELVTLDED
jgi:hypothetical protein